MNELKLKSPDEFFKNPQPCSAIEDTIQKLREEEWTGSRRELEDWNFLARKVVGAEND